MARGSLCACVASPKQTKMADLCNNDSANFQLNLTLDETPSDEEGLVHDMSNISDTDDETIDYVDPEELQPAIIEGLMEVPIEEEASDAVIANPDEKDRFYEVSDAQLDFIASQTVATSTKAQTRWGINIFKGKLQPTCHKNQFCRR